MSRLIDADELITILIDRDYIKTSRQEDNARELLNLAPTVDAVSREKYEASVEARHILVEFADDLLAELKERVEVVRCKDCKPMKYVIEKYKNGMCGVHSALIVMNGNDYCSYGERKEDNEQ